jgi:hypothetical protein
MVIPIRPGGPDKSSKKRAIPSEDIKAGVKSQKDLEALQKVHAVAKAAEAGQPRGIPAKTDPTGLTYNTIAYIQDAINYLKQEGEPYQFLQKQLDQLKAEGPHFLPNIQSSLTTLIFQVVRIGDTFGNVTDFKKQVAGWFGQGVAAAQATVQDIENQMKAMEASYPGLVDIIKIQTFLDNYKNQPNNASAFSDFALAVVDLAKHYSSLSGGVQLAAEEVFNALSGIKNLPIMMAAFLFDHAEAGQGNWYWQDGPPVNPQSGLVFPQDVPFMQAIKSALTYSGDGYSKFPGIGKHDESGYGPTYWIDDNYITEILNAFPLDGSQIDVAQNSVDQAVTTYMQNSPSGATFAKLQQQLDSAQATLAMLTQGMGTFDHENSYLQQIANQITQNNANVAIYQNMEKYLP